jgi:6-phospho-beta-glucosidase
MYPEALIGPAPNIMAVYPATCNPADSIAANNWASIRCWLYLDVAVYGKYTDLVWQYLVDREIEPEIYAGDLELLAEAKPDYIAMNYYATATVGASKGDGSDLSARGGDQQIMLGENGVYRAEQNSYLDSTDFVWAIDPIGLRLTLRKINERYHLPILITENGLGAKDILTEDGKIHDDYRIDFFNKHFKQAALAIADGVNLIGYCPWSAVDLISTHQGCSKRYGFIYVNRDEFDLKDMRRMKKDSFYWYQKVIESNGKILE